MTTPIPVDVAAALRYELTARLYDRLHLHLLIHAGRYRWIETETGDKLCGTERCLLVWMPRHMSASNGANGAKRA